MMRSNKKYVSICLCEHSRVFVGGYKAWWVINRARIASVAQEYGQYSEPTHTRCLRPFWQNNFIQTPPQNNPLFSIGILPWL